MQSIQIGSIEIDNPVIPAPMAGVTDYPFRQLLWKMNCDICFTEMVSSKGLVYGSKKTERLMDFSKPDKKYIGIQIFGCEPEIMKKAAIYIEKQYQADILDINMGCPASKIVKNGSGSALMKNLNLAEKIMSEVAGELEIPVTVKIRKGWDENTITAVELAKLAEKNGIKAVTVHGRTREQFYQKEADWEIIKKVKNNISIPVIGNGDVFSPLKAEEMLEETDCDGVMIARGLRGNPWLLKRINKYLSQGKLIEPPDFKEKIEMAIYHLKKAVNYFGEKTAIPRMRKHIAWYLKGLPYSTNIKNKINKLTEKQKVIDILNEYIVELQGYYENIN